MFWDAIQATFVVLTYWQIYAAGIEYVFIIFIPIVFAYFLGRQGIETGNLRNFSVILIPVFQAVGTLFFVFSVALIALGLAQYSTWKIPFSIALASPFQFLLLSIGIIITSIVLTALPIIGRFFAFQTLVLGGLALMMMFAINAEVNYIPPFSEIDWLPNFWFIIGVVIVGGIFGAIGTALVAAIPEFLRKLTGRDMGAASALIGLPIASTFGFVPFFIYAAWIGSQIG